MAADAAHGSGPVRPPLLISLLSGTEDAEPGCVPSTATSLPLSLWLRIGRGGGAPVPGRSIHPVHPGPLIPLAESSRAWERPGGQHTPSQGRAAALNSLVSSGLSSSAPSSGNQQVKVQKKPALPLLSFLSPALRTRLLKIKYQDLTRFLFLLQEKGVSWARWVGGGGPGETEIRREKCR